MDQWQDHQCGIKTVRQREGCGNGRPLDRMGARKQQTRHDHHHYPLPVSPSDMTRNQPSLIALAELAVDRAAPAEPGTTQFLQGPGGRLHVLPADRAVGGSKRLAYVAGREDLERAWMLAEGTRHGPLVPGYLIPG